MCVNYHIYSISKCQNNTYITPFVLNVYNVVFWCPADFDASSIFLIKKKQLFKLLLLLCRLFKYNPSYWVHEPELFNIQGEQDRVRAFMQINPHCCCWCSYARVNERALSLSWAQHQHLPDECAQQRKGSRTEKERGRGDILDKGDNKSMTIMELRRWGMSDLRKRIAEIWQWIQTKGWSWLPGFSFSY